MLSLLMLMAFSTPSLHANEVTFKCLAKSEASVTVMVLGTYDDAVNEPSGPVLIAGQQSSGPALAPGALGTPEEPRRFSKSEVTLDAETMHEVFIARIDGSDGSLVRLRSGEGKAYLALSLKPGPGRALVDVNFDDVSCLFLPGHQVGNRSWPDATAD